MMDDEAIERAKRALKDSDGSTSRFDADQFYEMAKHPLFPDKMTFQIRVANPANPYSFSKEGIEGTVDQMQAFIVARVMGQWRKTGKPPREMQIEVAINWKYEPEDVLSLGDMPWFNRDEDKGGLTQLDGEHRISRLDN
jgi:hypothetical protein